jgi:hypothetical protein
VCGKPFQGSKYCLAWQDHTSPGTRWAPRHLVGEKSKSDSGNKRKRISNNDNVKDTEESQDKDKVEVLRAAKKAYNAAKKDIRASKNN